MKCILVGFKINCKKVAADNLHILLKCYPFIYSISPHHHLIMPIVADSMYMGMTSSFGGTPPLNVGAGYGVVLGFGVFFSLFASFATFLDKRYAGTVDTR